MTKLDWEKANKQELPKNIKSKSQTQKRQEAVAKAYANGTARERERIIKLLEPYTECNDELCYPSCDCPRSELFIAFIKGETE